MVKNTVAPKPKSKSEPLNMKFFSLTMTEQIASTLPLHSKLMQLYSAFISGIFSMILCVVMELFMHAKRSEFYIQIAFVVLFIFMLFGSASTSLLPKHHKRSIVYAILFAVVSFVLLNKFNLYGADPRPLLMFYIGISRPTATLIVSCIIFFMVYATANTVNQFFKFCVTLSTPDPTVYKLEFCFHILKELMGFKRSFIVNHFTLIPGVSVIFYFVHRFLSEKIDDTIIDIIYVITQAVLAFVHLLFVRSATQINYLSSMRSLGMFRKDECRTLKMGHRAVDDLESGLAAVASNALALSLYPLTVLFAASLFGASFAINGVSAAVARITGLFVIFAMDAMMGTSRVAALILGDMDE